MFDDGRPMVISFQLPACSTYLLLVPGGSQQANTPKHTNSKKRIIIGRVFSHQHSGTVSSSSAMAYSSCCGAGVYVVGRSLVPNPPCYVHNMTCMYVPAWRAARTTDGTRVRPMSARRSSPVRSGPSGKRTTILKKTRTTPATRTQFREVFSFHCQRA